MVDLKKAYDSVDRKSLIEVLIKYKVNPRIIEIIVQMYAKDSTTITLGNMQKTIEVTCGIRQGCSISTLLFKMVTYNIIEKLENEGERYELGMFTGTTIWLADYVTLIANSEESLKKNIKILE